METSAIIIMVIGCGALWGGCAWASVYNYRYNKNKKKNEG